MRMNREMNDAMLEMVNGGQIVVYDHVICVEDEKGVVIGNGTMQAVYEYNRDTYEEVMGTAKSIIGLYNSIFTDKDPVSYSVVKKLSAD